MKKQSPINSPIRVWNRKAIEFMRSIVDDADLDIRRRSTGEAARIYALLNVAMHDAIATATPDPHLQFRPRWVTSASADGATSETSAHYAAAYAGHAVLRNLFQGANRPKDLDDTLMLLVKKPGKEEASEEGRTLGCEVANALLDDPRFERLPEDSLDDPHFRPGIGRFGRRWGAAEHRDLAPFVMNSANQFRSAPPPGLQSVEYARAFNEVKEIGSRTARLQNGAENSRETIMARFWSGGARTAQESGYWLEIALEILDARSGNSSALSLVNETRVMSAVAVAICDAMISSWDTKYAYSSWRPMPAIRDADMDLNPLTRADPTWEPLNGNMGGSPEHTSGTATFAGAACTVLIGFFGDNSPFTVDFQHEHRKQPDSVRPGAQTFDSFTEAAEIATRSRVFNGIHFSFAGTEGLVAGRAIGALVVATMGIRPIR